MDTGIGEQYVTERWIGIIPQSDEKNEYGAVQKATEEKTFTTISPEMISEYALAYPKLVQEIIKEEGEALFLEKIKQHGGHPEVIDLQKKFLLQP